jgi:hypothetical protein
MASTPLTCTMNRLTPNSTLPLSLLHEHLGSEYLKQRGAIASLREEINALAALGFRAHPQLVAAVL